MNNKIFLKLNKQQSILNNSFEEVIRNVDLNIENGRIKNMNLDLIDEPIDFVKNLEERNKFLKSDNKINLNDNLDNSKFGQKLLSKNIIKTEKISDVQIKKTAFNVDGRILSSVIDTKLSDDRLKRTWNGNTVIFKNDNIIFRSKIYKFDPIKL